MDNLTVLSACFLIARFKAGWGQGLFQALIRHFGEPIRISYHGITF